MAEELVETTFVITCTSYGHPEHVRRGQARQLAKALHHALPGSDIRYVDDVNDTSSSMVMMVKDVLPQVTFDPLAHDGEHVGHDGPDIIIGGKP